MNASSWLLHGPPGSGKTFTALSAFIDLTNGTSTAKGVWIRIGSEQNPRIQVPEANVKQFGPKPDNELAWISNLKVYLRSLVAHVSKGGELDFVVFDGISEFINLYRVSWTLKNGLTEANKWDMWGKIKDDSQAVISMLSPDLLGCHVIFTARVMERKKGVWSNKEGQRSGADPDYITAEYYPAADGWMRQNLGYLFPIVLYMEVVDGNHQVQLLPHGDYMVKNPWEDVLIKHRLKSTINNPRFQDILELFEKAASLVNVEPDNGLEE